MAQTERSTDIAKPPEEVFPVPLRARPRPAVDDGPQRLRAARRRPARHRLALPRAARRLRPAHRRRARDHRLRPARRRRDAHGDPRHRRHQHLRARARRRRHPPHPDHRGDGRRAEGPGADPGHPAPPREEARRRSRGAQALLGLVTATLRRRTRSLAMRAAVLAAVTLLLAAPVAAADPPLVPRRATPSSTATVHQRPCASRSRRAAAGVTRLEHSASRRSATSRRCAARRRRRRAPAALGRRDRRRARWSSAARTVVLTRRAARHQDVPHARARSPSASATTANPRGRIRRVGGTARGVPRGPGPGARACPAARSRSRWVEKSGIGAPPVPDRVLARWGAVRHGRRRSPPPQPSRSALGERRARAYAAGGAVIVAYAPPASARPSIVHARAVAGAPLRPRARPRPPPSRSPRWWPPRCDGADRLAFAQPGLRRGSEPPVRRARRERPGVSFGPRRRARRRRHLATSRPRRSRRR